MKELPGKIKNPVADGMLVLRSENATMQYRGEDFKYISYYYLWEETGERFTTNESDELSIGQVYDEYRRRHDIPSAEEISALRRRCGLSAAKMSALLGIGINQYRLYEAGEVPSLSIGKILNVLCHSNEALRQYAKLGKAQLGEKKYANLIRAIS